MKIFRYTEAVQQALRLKLNPEPWMHVILDNTNGVFAIYVWDTRQIVFSGKIKLKVSDKLMQTFVPARDNKAPLVGKQADLFNPGMLELSQPINVAAIDVNAQVPDEHDIMRAENLKDKTVKTLTDRDKTKAYVMSRVIKDPHKLVRRTKAFIAKYGKASDLVKPFYDALQAAGFDATQIANIKKYKAK